MLSINYLYSFQFLMVFTSPLHLHTTDDDCVQDFCRIPFSGKFSCRKPLTISSLDGFPTKTVADAAPHAEESYPAKALSVLKLYPC